MKEIIAADPMKEVLHLRATFGPRRETMKEIIEADSIKDVLHLTFTLWMQIKIKCRNLSLCSANQ